MADLQLVMNILATDQASPGLAAAAEQVRGLGTSVSGMTQGMGEGAAATEKMKAAAEGAGGGFATLKEHAAGLGEQLKDVASTAAGFIGANALMSFGSNLASSFEQGISTAEHLGESVHALMLRTGESAETLTPMVAAMERMGISSDGAENAIQRFSRALTSVYDGTDKTLASTTGVIGAFKDLGINVDQLHTEHLGLNDALMLVADQFAAMPDGVQKTNAAMAIFGRNAGPDLIQFLNQGSGAIKDTMAVAEKYGFQLSTENVEQIHQFGLAHKDMDIAMQGVMVTLGVGLMPLLTSGAEAMLNFTQAINSNVVPAIRQMGDNVQMLTEWLNEHQAVELVLVGVLGMIATAAGISAAAWVAHTAVTTAAAIATEAQTAAQWLLNAAMDANPIGLVIVALGGLAAAFIWAYNNIQPFHDAIDTAWSAITDIVIPGLQALSDMWTSDWGDMRTILTAFWDDNVAFVKVGWDLLTAPITLGLDVLKGLWTGDWTDMRTDLTTIWTDMQNLITTVFSGAIMDLITNTLTAIVDVWTAAWTAVTDFLNTTWDNIRSAVQGAIDAVLSIIQGWVADVQGALTNLRDSASSLAIGIGDAIVNGIASGIASRIDAVRSAAVNVVTTAINAAKAAAGISSPSQVFYSQVGQPIVDGVNQALIDGTAAVAGYSTNLANAAINPAIASIAQLNSAIGTIPTTIHMPTFAGGGGGGGGGSSGGGGGGASSSSGGTSYAGHSYDLSTDAGRAQLINDAANNVVPSGPGGTSISRLLQGKASGGGVVAGEPYIVGEAGPEFFMPGVSGSIVPNAGGGGVAAALERLATAIMAQPVVLQVDGQTLGMATRTATNRWNVANLATGVGGL